MRREAGRIRPSRPGTATVPGREVIEENANSRRWLPLRLAASPRHRLFAIRYWLFAPQLAANRRSLIASKFCTPPPTRLVV